MSLMICVRKQGHVVPDWKIIPLQQLFICSSFSSSVLCRISSVHSADGDRARRIVSDDIGTSRVHVYRYDVSTYEEVRFRSIWHAFPFSGYDW